MQQSGNKVLLRNGNGCLQNYSMMREGVCIGDKPGWEKQAGQLATSLYGASWVKYGWNRHLFLTVQSSKMSRKEKENASCRLHHILLVNKQRTGGNQSFVPLPPNDRRHLSFTRWQLAEHRAPYVWFRHMLINHRLRSEGPTKGNRSRLHGQGSMAWPVTARKLWAQIIQICHSLSVKDNIFYYFLKKKH